MTEFNMLGLDKTIMYNITQAGYDKATPIQAQAIPLVLDGHDLIGLAQTGTGKTAAFGLPMVENLIHLEGRPAPKSVKALILAPTRELVNQICDNLSVFVRSTPIKVFSVVGGQSINRQINRLERGVDILVATPGRLMDLVDRRAVYLDSAKMLVLDEADQMLDMGFIHALRKIAPLLGTPRQTLLFSATMPKQMEELAGAFLTNPKRVQVAAPGKAADKITQSLHFVKQAMKVDKLKDCLDETEGQAIVFLRTKHTAEKLMKHLVAEGYTAASIHGNKSQGQRDRAIKAFKSGEIRILVATDVAARGIDIPDVSHVYNYDLPEVAENYVHRIGRTARAGKDGAAVAFVDAQEIGYLRAIQKVMKMNIPVESGIEPAAEDPPKRGGGGGGRGRRGGGGGKPSGGRAQHARGGKPGGFKSGGGGGKPSGRKPRRRKPAA
ncbi:DEAD/DEAH box helicase [Algirhabdus cladophorae]|uniref:DEAD/DEAH box helicase n=1 Tax=Algirhabdus cladophorae TaxID=3377108 RepID=UPI003B8491CB